MTFAIPPHDSVHDGQEQAARLVGLPDDLHTQLQQIRPLGDGERLRALEGRPA